MHLLNRAISIAKQAHTNQKDKAGANYIHHPMRVMNAGKTTDEKIVGVLHDVIEDSYWTFDMLKGRLPELTDNDVIRLKKYLKAYKDLLNHSLVSSKGIIR